MTRFLLSLFAVLIFAGCSPLPPYPENQVEAEESRYDFTPGTFDRLDRELQREDQEGDIPSGALVIWRRGERVYSNAFGTAMPEGRGAMVTPKTLFDVASLTKPMAGVPAGVLLSQHPQTTFFEKGIILRLFQHSLGLDDKLHYPRLHNVDEYFKPETMRPMEYRYANANFLFLTFRVDAMIDNPEQAIRDTFWVPMELERLTCKPDDVAVWSGMNDRGYPLMGKPYDPVANQLVSSEDVVPLHSGLFADAEEVALFGEKLLHPDTPKAQQLSKLLIGNVEELRWADDPQRSINLSAGGMISPTDLPFAPPGMKPGRFYCQTGYTGCLLWIDTQTETSVALLTNSSATDAADGWKNFSEAVIQIILRGSQKDF